MRSHWKNYQREAAINVDSAQVPNEEIELLPAVLPARQ
jgi:hypothetical protein